MVKQDKQEEIEWLTVDQVAARLQVERATIYKWAKAGRLKLYKFAPKVTRLKWEDVEALAQVKEYKNES
jgi:excisionase family DNA binding protein